MTKLLFYIRCSVVALSFSLALSQSLTQEQKDRINELSRSMNLAHDFSLKSIDDSLYVLSELRGKVVLINFWATWCGPCRMEIPEFNELYASYHSKGFEILGISVSDNKKQLKNFIKSFAVDYPLLSFGYLMVSSFLLGLNLPEFAIPLTAHQSNYCVYYGG